MLVEIYDKQKAQNEKSLQSLKKDFSTLRTGRVNILPITLPVLYTTMPLIRPWF